MSLILVDGSALVYRSFYAFAARPLTAPTGEATSIAFGFCSALLKLIQDYRPSHLAVVFDLKGPTFRHAMYPEYKSNRKPMPDELAAQLPRLRELLDAWGLAVLERDGYEADDVMATVAVRSAGVVAKAWHYTGDKDFMQLLDDRVGMLKPGRRGDEIAPFTVADVEREYGLTPRTLIDVFALSGDKSDNIPGAPGIGDRTALEAHPGFRLPRRALRGPRGQRAHAAAQAAARRQPRPGAALAPALRDRLRRAAGDRLGRPAHRAAGLAGGDLAAGHPRPASRAELGGEAAARGVAPASRGEGGGFRARAAAARGTGIAAPPCRSGDHPSRSRRSTPSRPAATCC